MFTGIITGTGRVTARTADPVRGVERLDFDAPGHTEAFSLGGSIAVNGVCVSAVAIEEDRLTVELIAETMRRTTFGDVDVGDRLNLERCLPAGARLDGHVVQGHVDGVATLTDRGLTDGRHRFSIDPELAPLIAEKGSIAVDGVSLTISATGSDEGHWFEVGLIPTTLRETNLGELNLGDRVNLETDVLAKYVRRMLGFSGRRELSNSPTAIALGDGESSRQTGAGAAEGLAGAGPRAARSGDPAGEAHDPVVPVPNTPAPVLDHIEVALNQLAQGRPVVVVDDADRENEGDLIFPAAAATQELMAMTIRYTSGVLCAPMTAERAAHLDLPPMTAANEDPKGTAYTISCDAEAVTATGISAEDRAITAQTLADPAAAAAQLTRPGHMFPLIAADGGVLSREGHTEAAVDLCRLAGYSEVGIIAELTHDDGTMMRLPGLREFADAHELALISIADLIEYRGGAADPDAVRESYLSSWEQPQDAAAKLVTGGPQVTLPTDHGVFTAQVWTENATGQEHILLSSASADSQNPLVRLHSECLTGDVLGSHRCDCGTQLSSALETIEREGGHLLYLRGHEGRGIGLANKMRAYQLQEQGADTVEANEMLGLAAELRDYTEAAAILHSAGVDRMRLLTNNPAKVQALTQAGLTVEKVPSNAVVRRHNARYLRTKRDKMAHVLDHLALQEQDEITTG